MPWAHRASQRAVKPRLGRGYGQVSLQTAKSRARSEFCMDLLSECDLLWWEARRGGGGRAHSMAQTKNMSLLPKARPWLWRMAITRSSLALRLVSSRTSLTAASQMSSPASTKPVGNFHMSCKGRTLSGGLLQDTLLHSRGSPDQCRVRADATRLSLGLQGTC